jgi:hypothetical protein
MIKGSSKNKRTSKRVEQGRKNAKKPKYNEDSSEEDEGIDKNVAQPKLYDLDGNKKEASGETWESGWYKHILQRHRCTYNFGQMNKQTNMHHIARMHICIILS